MSDKAAIPMGHYIDVNNMEWTPSRVPGSVQKTLFSDPETGKSTVLFKLAPGAVIPYHEHPEMEQTYVLEGSLEDDSGVCTAGNFVWRPAGSRHEARAPNGVTMLVVFNKTPVRMPKPE
jgi:anti-sigma factor ChrR (cupin superfamily)